MFLSSNNFVGSGAKYMFGDGSYSGNIMSLTTYMNPYSYAGATSSGVTRIERYWTLPAGSTVAQIGAYGANLTANLYIVRRNSAGSYTVVYKQVVILPASGGWNWFPMDVPYVVPNDGMTYHLAISCIGSNYSSGGGAAYADGPADPGSVGATFTASEATGYCPLVTAKIVGPALQPQTTYNQLYQYNVYSKNMNNGNTHINKGFELLKGRTVTHLGMYASDATTATLCIYRMNAAGSYTPVANVSITTVATAGFQYVALPTPYVVPQDGFRYFVGVYSPTVYVYSTGTLTVDRAVLVSTNATVVGTTYTGFTDQSGGGVAHVSARYSMEGAIVVTDSVVVLPDPATGAAVFTCKNLVVDGKSAKLVPLRNCKGLLGIVSVSSHVVNGATASMSKLGKAGNFGNLTLLDLVPANIRRKLKAALSSYIIQGRGALGAPSRTGASSNGVAGTAAGPMQTGGGGSGGVYSTVTTTAGAAGGGGPCCGGAGGGGMWQDAVTFVGPAAGDYGGPGGPGANARASAGGGAGDPPGPAGVGTVYPSPAASPGDGPGGGLLYIIAPFLYIGATSVVQADGARGGAGAAGGGGPYAAGGSAGGGCIVIITLVGGYTNNGTVRANGGAAVSATTGAGGPGGAGSINIFTVSV